MPISLMKQIHPDFSDERGDIFKLLDDGKTSIKSVLLITCRKGAVRANHYHKDDSHYVYMVSGKMEYYQAPVKNPGKKKESVIVNAGDMIFTPPKVVHAMRFLEDSVFLALSPKSRSPKDYENDTVRVKII